MNKLNIASQTAFWQDILVFFKANSHITIIADLAIALILMVFSIYYSGAGASKLKNPQTPRVLMIGAVVVAIAAGLNWLIAYFLF